MEGNCYICGKWAQLERHHVYGGRGRREKSEKYGAVVDLCHYCHNEPPDGVHHNGMVRLSLQEEFQRKLMAKYNWSIADFVNIFWKNYL